METIKFWIIYRFSEDKGVWKVYAYTDDKDLKEAFQTTRKMCRYKIAKHEEIQEQYDGFISDHIDSKLMLYEGCGVDKDGEIFHFNIPITVSEYNEVSRRLQMVYMYECHRHGFKAIPPFDGEYRDALADLLYYVLGNFVRDKTDSGILDKYAKTCYEKNTWNIVLDVIGGDLI